MGIDDVNVPKGAIPASVEFEMSLDEYCRRLSARKKSTEMIGGFYSYMSSRGIVALKETDFAEAFVTFSKRAAY